VILVETVDRRRRRACRKRERAEARGTGPAIIQAGLAAGPQRPGTILEQAPHDRLRARSKLDRRKDPGSRIEAIEAAVTAHPNRAVRIGQRIDRSAARALAAVLARPPGAECFGRGIEAHQTVRGRADPEPAGGIGQQHTDVPVGQRLGVTGVRKETAKMVAVVAGQPALRPDPEKTGAILRQRHYGRLGQLARVRANKNGVSESLPRRGCKCRGAHNHKQAQQKEGDTSRHVAVY
jgi:hypothetical protein